MKKIYLALSMLIMAATSAFAQGETCADALAVPGSGIYSADGPKTGSGNHNGCFNGGNNADWYKYTPVCDGKLSITNELNGLRPGIRLSIYDGTCAALACKATGPINRGVVNNLSITGGTTYYIEFDDSWNGASRSPANDWKLTFKLDGAVNSVNPQPQITDAVVSWNPAALEPCWQFQYGKVGFALGAGTVMNPDSTGGPFVVLNNLSPETTYDYYVAVCDANGNPTGCYDGPHQFTTLPLCPVPTNFVTTATATDVLVDWDPGFGGQSQWEFEHGPTGTIIGAGTSSTQNQSSALATPLLSCTEYDYYVRAVCNTSNPPTINSAWVGPIQFMTECVCPEPSGLSSAPDAGADPFKYDLSWTNGGTETMWDVQVGPVGFLIGSQPIVSANSNPYTASVTPDSELEYYVRSVCGSTPDSISKWVGPHKFKSDVFCPVPLGLSVKNVTTIGGEISWNIVGGFGAEWTLEWGPAGFSQGTGTPATVYSNNVILTGLTPDTEYCYYVKSNCGSTLDSTSQYAGPYCFKTLAACPMPTQLSVLNLTHTAVTLDWQAGANETAWNLAWGLPGFTPGDTNQLGSGAASGGISSYYATGLNAAAPYCFYVQADCGGLDGTSLWQGPFCFTTTLVNDVACGAIELPVDASVNLHTNVGATVNGENAILPKFAYTYTFNQTSWFGDNRWMQLTHPVWFKFEAPESGKVEVSTMNSITQNANTATEIAVYETGDCGIITNFQVLAANTFGSGSPWNTVNNRGSKVLLCDLTPQQTYYVMVDNFRYLTYTSYNGTIPGIFGISVTEIPAVDAGDANPITICGDGSEFDLFDAVTGHATNSGVWYNPNKANRTWQRPGTSSVISLPAGAGVYEFEYEIDNACGTDAVQTTITTVEPPNAGMDGSYSACNTEDIWLMQYLNGSLEFGGKWEDANGVHDVSNGTFNGYGVQYGTYRFNYIVEGSGDCENDTSTVVVTLTDDCLGLDNESNTTNFEVYPNPVNDVLTIANLNVNGNALITVYDVQGKVVFRNDVTNNNNYTIDMTSLEAGLYVVEVTSDNTSEKVRVIKQ